MNSATSLCPSIFARCLCRPAFLFLLLFFLSFAIDYAESYQVLRVYDGDIITILNDGNKQSIRNQIESYIEHHTDVGFSHGMCPDCMEEIYGNQDWYKRGKEKGKF
ncbi:putative PAS domain protein [Desulfosarcina variabilis str. Montpellier]